MEICKKCIIPSSFPNVAVENGICTFCRLHEQSPIANKGLLGKDELKSILSSKTNGKYPCIVGLSGGKDSSYVLYCLVKKMGLKPLAAFFDNDFITDYAKENIQNLCNNLNVDLVIGKATTFRKKIIRENLHLSKYNIAFDACTNCENNLRSFIINEANNNKIPFIVYGATDYEDPYMMFLKPTTPTFRMIRSKERFEIIKTMKRMKWEYVDPLFLPMNLADKLKFYFHYLLSKYYVVRDNIKMKSPEGFRNLRTRLRVKTLKPLENKGFSRECQWHQSCIDTPLV